MIQAFTTILEGWVRRMHCLELRIPPLPQLITAGHTIWQPGMQHFRRSFPVYDLLIVKAGRLYMTEDDQVYELGPGELLILEPGCTHWGHRPVQTQTEIYWLHFIHPNGHRHRSSVNISWSGTLLRGCDEDLSPTEQFMVLPKHAEVDPDTVFPLLREIVSLHQSLTYDRALPLHVAYGQLLTYLQSVTQGAGKSRSRELSEQVMRYLQAHMDRPFSATALEKELHFHFDYLSRCLKKHIDMTPLQYLHHLQMVKAKWLLRQTDLRIQDIAEQVGQPNVNYFSRLFRKCTGVSPSQYRKKYVETL